MARANTTGKKGEAARSVPRNRNVKNAMPRAYRAVTTAVETVYNKLLRRITRISISWNRMIA